MLSHVDIWRTDNEHSPVQKSMLKSLQRRLRKYKRQAGQQDFQDKAIEKSMIEERAAAEREEDEADKAFDEEFASLSFEDVLRETKAEMAAMTTRKSPPKP